MLTEFLAQTAVVVIGYGLFITLILTFIAILWVIGRILEDL